MDYWTDLTDAYIQFEWAAFIHSMTGFDAAYYDTIKMLDELKKGNYQGITEDPVIKFYTDDYLKKVRKVIENNPNEEITVGSTILFFLHAWHTQGIPNALHENLSCTLRHLATNLYKLSQRSIVDFPCNEDDEQIIKCLYNELKTTKVNPKEGKGERGLGPTGISKTLHIFYPEVFVMWDAFIKKTFEEFFYKDGNKPKSDSPAYVDFLKQMKDFANKNSVNNDMASDIQTKLRGWIEASDSSLPDQILTVAKLIDEYNWVKITAKRTLPPTWWPGRKD